MEKQNYSLLVLIMRIIAGVFGAIAFALMFLHQLDLGSSGSIGFAEIAFGSALRSNPAPIPFIGYILIAIAAVASIVLIFIKDVLGNAKLVKMIDFVVAGAFILGGILVVMTEFWYWACNASAFTSAYMDEITLAGAPIAAFVFAVIAAALNIINGTVEEKI